MVKLVNRAKAVESMAGLGAVERLQAWLDQLALDGREERDDEAEATARVALMTVHTSKGLEFPVVFVVHMMEGTFPHKRSLESEAGVEEERRLAYVAFTRAQRRLVVTRSRTIHKHGAPTRRASTTTIPPSRFLYGLPTGAIHGDIPRMGPRPEEGGDPLAATNARLRRFIGRRDEAAPDPDVEVTTTEIERLEQLEPGARVLAPARGLGRVDRRRGEGSAASILVRFDDGTSDWLSPFGGAVQLVLREEARPDP